MKMPSETKLKKRTSATTSVTKTEFKICKENYTRDPISKHREQKKDENSEEKISENLYPFDELAECETEDESDTFEESHDKKSFEKSTRNIHFQDLFSLRFAILCCLLLGGWIVYSNYFSGRKTGEIVGETKVSLPDLIQEMENRFKIQHELTYRILKVELKKVFGQSVEPSAPAIITLVANEGAESTASEFSQHLVRKLAPDTHLLINDTKYWDDEPDNILLKIDKEIRSFAKGNHSSIIVVDKVEKIPAKAAMIFHSYCDHEAAPYKRAMFLFIVPANKKISLEASVRDIDEIAMNRLRDIWDEATNDIIDSLITRLTVSVVSIR